MKAADLHAVWSAPDNSRLTAKQSSFRLPVHVAAKLAALGELYPNKSRTQLVGDLLATAVDACIGGLESRKGGFLCHVPLRDDPFDEFEDVGPLGLFKHAANKHFEQLERELGNDAPVPLYPYDFPGGGPDEPAATFKFQERTE